MAGCHVIDIHDIHPGFNIGRHAAFHEIHDDLSRWGRLHIACADRGAWIHDDDRQPRLCKRDDLLLSQVLRPFVVAGHLIERNRRLFRAEPSAWRNADGADGTAVDDPFDSNVARRFQQILGTGDINIVKDRGILGPERIVGCHMVELPAAHERFS